jgi:Glyoxalase-like domain
MSPTREDLTARATLFHHVGLITHEMDQTISRYEQLGFFFTPLSLPRIILKPGQPPEPFGAGNRTVIFEDNYLEILAHTDLGLWNSTTPQQRGPYDLDVPLARYEGMHVMHFGTDDLVGLHDRLTAEGVTCTGIKPFERNVDTPSGPQMMKALAFSFPPGAQPRGPGADCAAPHPGTRAAATFHAASQRRAHGDRIDRLRPRPRAVRPEVQPLHGL